MKKYLNFIVILLSTFIFSQETEFRKVDYDQIKKEISDKNSEYYYSTLMDRFQKVDTTLTAEHMYRLYYGHSFQKDFNVFAMIEHPKEIENIENKNTEPTPDDVKILKKYYTTVYNKQPFVNLNNIETLAVIYSFENDTVMVNKLLKIFYTLIDGILLTGDAKSLDTAIDVITARHEYNFVNIFELKVNGQALKNKNARSYDVLSTENEEGEKFDLYFDVTRSFEFYNQKFK